MTDLRTHMVLVLFGLTMVIRPVFAELKDPTRPPDYLLVKPGTVPAAGIQAGGAASASGFVLMSTMISGARRAAVINGELVRKGDKLGDMKVVDIEPYKVLLKGADKKIILTLIKDEDLIRKSINEKARVK